MWTVSHPLLGDLQNARATPFGLHGRQKRTKTAAAEPASPLVHTGSGHCVTVMPSGAGKSTLLIGNLLTYANSIVCVDLKRELVRTGYHFRRHVLKQRVHVVAPHGVDVPGIPTSRLDPAALLRFRGRDLESAAQMVASMLLAEQRVKTNDVFWSIQAERLIASLLAHMGRQTGDTAPSLAALIDYLYGDTTYKLAVLADTALAKGSYEYQGVTGYLSLPDGNNGSTRTCVLSTAQAAVSGLCVQAIRDSMGPSDLLDDLMSGEPTTVFLCLPAEHLEGGQGPVMRLWLETILRALQLRDATKASPVVVAVDEAGLIGGVPALKTMTIYMRSSGVKLWSFYQDASQVQAVWKESTPTMLNNCSCITVNAGTRIAARELAAMLQLDASQLYDVRPMEHLVLEGLAEPRAVAIPRWWADERFAGRVNFMKENRGKAKEKDIHKVASTAAR